MNDSEKVVKKPIHNSALFENEEYNKSIAEKDAVISEKDEVIKELSKQIGERDRVITGKDKEIAIEKNARKKAENLVTDQKNLDRGPTLDYVPKTEEEKFADLYKSTCERLRNK